MSMLTDPNNWEQTCRLLSDGRVEYTMSGCVRAEGPGDVGV